MPVDKVNEFISTTQFQCKLNAHKKNLHHQLRKDYLRDISSVGGDSYNDIDIYIADGDVHLRHRCVISAICPLLLFNNLSIIEPSNNKTICLDTYPDDIQPHEKNILKQIYTSNQERCFDDIEITEINFSSLFEDGSFSDVVFKVQDEEFKCHKSIISCRCEYFARMFSGHWKENEQDLIELKDVSSKTFRFVLFHIYSGETDIPEDVDLTELLLVADMYGINGIKLIVSHHLKAYYCLFFIAPCEICITGVNKCLEIAKMFSLGPLAEECYGWFVKNYGKIFSNRSFSKSSSQLREDIKDKIKANITRLTIVRHLKDCSKLKHCLPTVNWAHSLKPIIDDLEEYCQEFVCNHFETVTDEPSFQYCLINEKDINSALMVQEHFTSAVSKYVSKDNCLDIYKSSMAINVMLGRVNTEVSNKKEAVDNCNTFISDVQDICKKFIRKNILHIQKTKKWKNMDEEIKDQLMSASGFLSFQKK